MRAWCTPPCVQVTLGGQPGSRSCLHGLTSLTLWQISHPTPFPPPTHTCRHGMGCLREINSLPEVQVNPTSQPPYCLRQIWQEHSDSGRSCMHACMLACMHANTCIHAWDAMQVHGGALHGVWASLGTLGTCPLCLQQGLHMITQLLLHPWELHPGRQPHWPSYP